MTSHAARRLAAKIRHSAKKTVQADPQARGADWRNATVGTVGVDGTITTTDGIIARRMENYLFPQVAELCIITQSGNGNWLAAGRANGSGPGGAVTYTPTITGVGTATFSTRTGWYVRMGGKLVYFNAYFVASAAGSGTSNLMISTPSAIDRSTTRQVVPGHIDNSTTNGNGTCSGVTLTGGTGAVFDRLRGGTGQNLTGADILSTTTITLTGWYREA